MMPSDELALALQLAQWLMGLLSGKTSAVQTAQAMATLTANNAWLVAHGLPPVTIPSAT
jgi:hypothetical protein